MKTYTILICIPCLVLLLLNSAETQEQQEQHYEEIEIDEGPVLNQAIQLIEQKVDGSLSLNKNAIKSVIKNTRLGKRKAVIISVVGAYRRGKSFLLNFMIRYLRAQGRSDWIGSANSELEGFSWSAGKTRNTNGILLWPEIFPVGEDMAVMLLDTQGSFDSEATFKENSFIFALSTLMSSISVYNLHERIQMDDLDNLQFFMELGRLAQDDSQNKPFQNLLFLIRDWKYHDESPYGFEGGKSELFHWLKKHAEQRGTKDTLASYFSQVACYLMPYPGDVVSRSTTFRGKISEIDKVFTKHLDILLNSILSGPGLVSKQFSGQNVQIQNFPDVMEKFLNSLQSDKVPQPRSLLESTAALSNILLARDAKDSYKLTMDSIFADKKSVEDLEGENLKAKNAALEYFDTTRKFGGPDLAVPHRIQLIKELDSRYEIYKSRNDKRIQFEREAQMKMQILNRVKDMFEWTMKSQCKIFIKAKRRRRKKMLEKTARTYTLKFIRMKQDAVIWPISVLLTLFNSLQSASLIGHITASCFMLTNFKISNIACLNMENIHKFIENFDWNKIMESLDITKLIQMIDLKTSGVFYIGAILLVIARVAATLYNRINKSNDREQTPIIEDPE